MKNQLYFLIGALLLLASCKKDPAAETPNTINPTDAKSVSAAVKVWHATRLSGNAPSPVNNGNGPVLDPDSDGQELKTINGRYAIIQPEVLSGEVSGYYLSIQGASEYFKIDYSLPRNTGRLAAARNAAAQRNRNLPPRTSPLHRMMDNADSAIVIQIPENIHPGEFCISYCVYDAQGNISQPITACISVETFGGDASTDFLEGTWRFTHYKETSGVWETDTLEQYYTDVYCQDNKLYWSCDSTFGPCTPINILYDVTKYQLDIMLTKTGAFQTHNLEYYKYLNFDFSTCSNYVYEEEEEEFQSTGAWSYNATTNTLTLIAEFNELGEPDYWFEEYKLIKVSNTVFELESLIYDESYRFEKK